MANASLSAGKTRTESTCTKIFISSGIGGSHIPGVFSLEGVIKDHGLPIGEQLKLATAPFMFDFWVKHSRGTMVGNGFTDPHGKPLGFESLPQEET
jgi:hypothetical protein